ncbi:MBL fold metallo-hydrolase [Patescibacteria group bacterium]|nr:MBL fold metallo-hydrolase [Patescibacteria group bacterium]MBU1705837.1 MBL fold metallo-hydrolase [Patescibacteria group bacterium]
MALQTSRQQKKSRLTKARPSLQPAVLALALLSLAFTIFFLESYQSLGQSRELKVWFFDVGQGDAIFIETPNHQQILIDGGPGSSVLSKLGGVMLPWDKSIDAIFFTHPDADHITGLIPVLERYEVAAIYETGLDGPTQTMQTLEAAIVAEGAAHEIIAAPQTFQIDGLTIRVLSPAPGFDGQMIKDTNAASVVCELIFKDTSILLAGDATADQEPDYGPLAGDVDVLKVGHHGSLTSTGVALLNAVTPEIAIISVGVDNRYGHPHPAVLERLNQRGITVFRTDQDGDILLISRGGEPEVFPAPLPF